MVELVRNAVHRLCENRALLVAHDRQAGAKGDILQLVPIHYAQVLEINVQVLPTGPAQPKRLIGVLGIVKHIQNQPGLEAVEGLARSAIAVGIDLLDVRHQLRYIDALGPFAPFLERLDVPITRSLSRHGVLHESKHSVLQKQISVYHGCRSRCGDHNPPTRIEKEVEGVVVGPCTEIQNEDVGVQLSQTGE